MFNNIFGMLRKRRCLDEDADAGVARRSRSSGSAAAVSAFNAGLPTHSNFGMLWDTFFSSDDGTSNSDANSLRTEQYQTAMHNDNNTCITTERPFNLNERFVTVLDQLDARVEKYRKDALILQEKRDFLLMSIDLIKSNDLMQNLSETEQEEISCYLQRVNSRLSTVELNVRTVRDRSQEDSLSHINVLIDMMITIGDPVLSRQRCQMYLNTCSSARESSIDMDAEPIDKKFESVLLGCTLDDQKNVKKRLQALMGYLNKQIIQH